MVFYVCFLKKNATQTQLPQEHPTRAAATGADVSGCKRSLKPLNHHWYWGRFVWRGSNSKSQTLSQVRKLWNFTQRATAVSVLPCPIQQNCPFLFLKQRQTFTRIQNHNTNQNSSHKHIKYILM